MRTSLHALAPRAGFATLASAASAASAAFVIAASLAGVSACNTPPPITVVRSADGHESVDGDPVKARRGAQELYQGARGGFWAVRDENDWKNAWPAGHAPAYPTDLPKTSMLLLAVSESKTDVELRIAKVIESTGTLHVWLTQTKAGTGCKPTLDHPPSDAVVVSRIEKPLKVYISEERAESCGEAPLATAKCRIGDDATWSDKVTTAKPGDKIDCELTAQSRGTFAISDRTLSVAKLPEGSSAKLAFARGPSRGRFTVDVFGSYTLHGEARDEGGRRGVTSIQVDALPPKTRDVIVQLGWRNFDASDDPETFPRVVLQAKETSARARRCAPDAAPADFCEVRKQGAYTHMLLKAGTERVPLSVDYLDERFDKGPVVCVQVYFDGTKTTDVCDSVHREAQAKWTIGTLDLTTGTIVELQSAVAPDADADAGAAPSAEATTAATSASPSQPAVSK